MYEEITTKVKKKAYELGYDLCGIIEAKSIVKLTSNVPFAIAFNEVN
jgi:hypothetical protein